VRRPRRPEHGFTLVELMVAVAIVVIFMSIVFSLTLTNYGGNAQNVSDSIAAQFSLARMRAVSTKRAHAVELKQTSGTQGSVTVWQCNTLGMISPTPPLNLSCTGMVNELDLPPNIMIWNAVTGANSTPTGGPAQAAYPFDMFVQVSADGTSPTGATVYVTDRQEKSKFRVLLYTITGASYDRPLW
jgi:prepilin-type N-terminal cleavage/methylation domain-containing protein